MFFLLTLVALVVGLLMGATGIGGILLIPAVSGLAGLGVHTAMATVLLTQFFTALVGLFLHHRSGNLAWPVALPVCLGAVSCGYLGALVNALVNAGALSLALSLIIIFAGAYTLLPSGRARDLTLDGSSWTQRAMLLGLGALVGFVSGLTGVGGPVLSIPLMVIIGFSPLLSIAASQAIQIAAAGSGTVGNLVHGAIDFSLAAWLTLLQAAGVIAGVKLAQRGSTRQLRLAIALVCLLVGLVVAWRALKLLWGG